jgi:hypothetical protein
LIQFNEPYEHHFPYFPVNVNLSNSLSHFATF